MKTRTIKTVENGNIAVDGPYAQKAGLTIEGDIAWNRTGKPALVKRGYSTVANGRCDDVVLEPGQGLRVEQKCSAYRFGVYQIVEAA
jgi:hypothetical protein